jgi:mRNA interferase MazF
VLLPVGTSDLPNESVVLCHQIRTIDKRRLSLFYGEIIDPDIHLEVYEALRFQLGMPK